jgi:hypothetical protein
MLNWALWRLEFLERRKIPVTCRNAVVVHTIRRQVPRFYYFPVNYGPKMYDRSRHMRDQMIVEATEPDALSYRPSG